MSYYEVKEIYPWLHSIKDPMNVYMYLVVGEKRALLYDTGHGIAPIEPVIKEITNLPFDVVLGHGHIDHANGAYQFDQAWIHEEDIELCLRHTSKTARRRVLEGLENPPEGFDAEAYIKSGSGNLKKLEEGHVFDLGGLQAEVVMMEGHTRGSIGLLIQEKRMLLNSDAANTHVWMFLKESMQIADYISMLERTINLPFDNFIVGHNDNPFPKEEYFRKFIDVAKNICVEKSKPYGAIPELKGMIYQEGNAAIVFSKNKL